MVPAIAIAGVMLFIMSVMDTLAYGVRTAGVLTRRLAISLALFNNLVVISRMSNLTQAPILGNIPDKVYDGRYTLGNVLNGLRIDLALVVFGVVVGALFMPTFIRLMRRGIDEMERRGSAPRTALYALSRFGSLPSYITMPTPVMVRSYLSLGSIPSGFLIFNIFVTAFYSIGVMSTVYAASIDHSLAGTCSMLSGIVNGIATMFLFIVVDPPAAIVIDQCINGKRPLSDAKVLNMYLVLTRFAGTLLGILLLPLMGQYVLAVARLLDRLL